MMTVKGATLQPGGAPSQSICKLKSVKCSKGENIINWKNNNQSKKAPTGALEKCHHCLIIMILYLIIIRRFLLYEIVLHNYY